MWVCLRILHQLQQALDGFCQVMVWYQLAGLQGCAAKSQCLAHKHKQKQMQLSDSLGRVKLTYIMISLKLDCNPVDLIHPSLPLLQPDLPGCSTVL